MAEPADVENAAAVRVLAFLGESLLVRGIEASLRGRQGVEIAVFDASRPDAAEVLDELSPDIIVFDLIPIQLSCVFSFLRTHTDVILIGLDIEHDLALVLSAEWRLLPTVTDLMNVIEARIRMKNGRPP
jgi:hypothetical protein